MTRSDLPPNESTHTHFEASRNLLHYYIKIEEEYQDCLMFYAKETSYKGHYFAENLWNHLNENVWNAKLQIVTNILDDFPAAEFGLVSLLKFF